MPGVINDVEQDAAASDTPPPPPGFKLESDGTPPPPKGFKLETQGEDVPPPSGFKIENPKGPYYRNDTTVKPHGRMQVSDDGNNWRDLPAAEQYGGLEPFAPLNKPQAEAELDRVTGRTPRKIFDPITLAQQGKNPVAPKFSDVAGSIWNEPDMETQAAVARNTSPRAVASKASGMPLADVAGKPRDPQLDVPMEHNPKTGMPYQPSLVPDLDAPGFVPGAAVPRLVEKTVGGLEDTGEAFTPQYNPQTGKYERTPAGDEAKKRQMYQGASDIISGTGGIAMQTAPLAIANKPVTTLGSIALGSAASEGAGAVAHKMNASPEAEELARNVAFFLPSVAGTVAGLRTGSIETQKGKFSAAEALGGRVKAGVARTADVISGRVKVGNTQFEVNIPRGQRPGDIGSDGQPLASDDVPPVPSTAQAQLQKTLTTMGNAKAVEAMAKNVASGMPPVPPVQPQPAPPVPSNQPGNKLPSSHIDAMAELIAAHPPAERDALIDEAHTNLTSWIAANDGKVYVDGRVYLAKTPEKAEALAAKIVNDAVAAHDKRTAEASQTAEQTNTNSQTSRKIGDVVSVGGKQLQITKILPDGKYEGTPAAPAATAPKPIQSFIDATRPKAAAPETPAVTPQPDKTTQNLTESEGAKGEVIPPRKPGELHPDKLDYGAWSLFGKENFSDLNQQQKDAVVRTYSKTTESQSIASPEGRHFIATGEKQGPVIEGGEPEPSAPTKNAHALNPSEQAEESSNYTEAVQITKKHGSASVSLLQRRLKIGYEEAAHLVNRMSDEGLVEAANGPRPRPVIEAHQPERRQSINAVLREKLKGASSEEKDRMIEEYHERERTSAKTGLHNYLAFEESADTVGKTHPHVGYADVDDFKKANTALGHYGVDKKILPMLGDLINQAVEKENGTVYAFHRSGDEFLFRASDPAAVGRVLAHVNEALKHAKFEIEKPNGKIVTHDGIGLSHGTGETEQAAEYNAENGTHPGSKPSRKKSGHRTGTRDADVRSLAGQDTAGQQPHQDHTPQRQNLLGDLGGSDEEHAGLIRPAASLKPGDASVVLTSDLHADPARFQYKGGTDEQGVTNALKDQQVYDQNKGGVLLVWKDPANGKVYVVNGHHRFELAKRAGEKTVLVRMINAPSAEVAKVVGAETNISEGHGSLVDAARFFKAAGINTPRDAMNRNLPLGQAKVTDGLAMARLDNSILDRVESGDIPEGRAVAIGKISDSPAQQDAVLQAIAKRESRSGKPVNNGEAESIARQVRDADTHVDQGQDLFGAFSHEQSLYGEQAEIDDYVLKQLHADKRTFGAVASKARAETLGKVKDQQINQSENQRISEQAAQAAELYTKLVNSPGPLYDIRKNAAKNLASRYSKPQDIKAKAYAAVREQLQKSMSGDSPLYSQEPATAPSSETASSEEAGRQPVKGDTVTLRGGQVGTVKYVDSQMGVVRVQLANGPTKTFPLRDVLSSGNRSGEAGFVRMDAPASIAKAVLHYLLEPSDETKVARSVDDRMFQLDRQYEADVLRTKKLLETVKTTPEDQEAIYHHIENPNEPITPAQQRFYDNYVEPLTEASREMRSKLIDAGIPVGESPDGYIHRVVQGRTSQLGRVASGQKGGTGKGNVLSKYASSLQRRQMFAAERTNDQQLPLSDEQPGPSRIVVHRGDGKITGFQNGEGFEFAKDKPGLEVGDDFKDKDGKEWTLLQATTKEIEEHTNLRYYKNALATSIADYLQLRRAERANEALEAMKEDPDFQRMAFKSDRGNRGPDGWKATTLPQFQGWVFEPHTAEVLQRYADLMHSDPYTWLDRVGNILTASLLLNPVKHILNIGNHWLVERGVSGNFNPLQWPKATQAGVRAIKAVLTQNDDFLTALDRGAPMMSHRQDLQRLHQKLYELLLEHLENDHTAREKVAQFVGLAPQGVSDTGVVSAATRASGIRLLNNMRLLGQRAMWMSNDLFMLQSAYEKQLNDPNLSFKDAMALVTRHIPDYRIPGRVFNSKMLGDLMRNPASTIFSRYHYGVLKSYGEMFRETLSPDVTAADRRRGLDHLAMLLITTTLLYWLAEKAAKKLTGDPNAKLTRSGASSIPSAIAQVAEGHRPPGDLITGSLTPSPLLRTGAELVTNRDFYSGGKVYDEHDSNENILKDIGAHVAGALGPVQQYRSASHRENPTRDLLYSQIGVTFPKYETQTKAQRLMHELLRNNMPPLGPEQRREMDDRRARIASGKLSSKEHEALLKKQTLSEFQIYLPHLRYMDVKRVYDSATPEEKKIIRPILFDKADKLMQFNPYEGQREHAIDAFKER